MLHVEFVNKTSKIILLQNYHSKVFEKLAKDVASLQENKNLPM